MCVSPSLALSLYKARCAVCRECRLPLTTVAWRPFWSDFIASGTLTPWLTMNTTNSPFLQTQMCFETGGETPSMYTDCMQWAVSGLMLVLRSAVLGCFQMGYCGRSVIVVSLMAMFLWNLKKNPDFFNQSEHKRLFFGGKKLWKWDRLSILSLSFSVAAILSCPLSLSIPYVLLLQNPAHMTLYHPSFSPSNSLSLCSGEIRCFSLWAVVRCERRGALLSAFNYLQHCRPMRAATHNKCISLHIGGGHFSLCVRVCMAVSMCMCSMFPGIAV